MASQVPGREAGNAHPSASERDAAGFHSSNSRLTRRPDLHNSRPTGPLKNNTRRDGQPVLKYGTSRSPMTTTEADQINERNAPIGPWLSNTALGSCRSTSSTDRPARWLVAVCDRTGRGRHLRDAGPHIVWLRLRRPNRPICEVTTAATDALVDSTPATDPPATGPPATDPAATVAPTGASSVRATPWVPT